MSKKNNAGGYKAQQVVSKEEIHENGRGKTKKATLMHSKNTKERFGEGSHAGLSQTFSLLNQGRASLPHLYFLRKEQQGHKGHSEGFFTWC